MRQRRSPPDPADALAYRAAREVCRRQAGELYFASAFLPTSKRNAAHAAFAFCRMLREAIESSGGEAEQGAAGLRHMPLSAGAGCCSADPLEQRVALVRDRLDDLYAGRLELPSPGGRSQEQHVLHALAASVRRYQIPRQYFLDLARGFGQDLSVSRYATWSSLDRYCQLTGGSAGLIVSAIFGVTHPDAARHAALAGKAVRLTQILRDLKSDAQRGRVYVPLEDLAAFRYSERELIGGVVNENFRRLMCFQIERARRVYREAAQGLDLLAGDGSRLTAATVLVSHAGILDAIERQGGDVFSRRPRLTKGRRFRRLPLAWRLARRRPGAIVSAFGAAGDAEPEPIPLAAAR